jgi:hypothetical protein
MIGHYITEAVAETGCLVALDIMVRLSSHSRSAEKADETGSKPLLTRPSIYRKYSDHRLFPRTGGIR